VIARATTQDNFSHATTLRDPVTRGFDLKGGYVFTGPWGAAVTPNITSHPKSSIGTWTDAEIKRVLTHGVARDGRAFQQPMARQIYFRRMIDADLD